MPESVSVVESFRDAARQVDQMPSQMEREVAAAALRLEADHLVRQNVTRGGALSESDVESLRRWAGDYVDGARASRVVAGFDNALKSGAQSVLTDVSKWALLGNQVIGGAGILGVVGAIVLYVIDFGKLAGSAAFGVTTGAIVIPGAVFAFAVRSAPVAMRELANSARTTWDDANQLGIAGEKVLRETVLARVTSGSVQPGLRFIAGARTRAQLVVGGCFALCAIAAALLLFGAVTGYQEWQDYQNSVRRFP